MLGNVEEGLGIDKVSSILLDNLMAADDEQYTGNISIDYDKGVVGYELAYTLPKDKSPIKQYIVKFMRKAGIKCRVRWSRTHLYVLVDS